MIEILVIAAVIVPGLIGAMLARRWGYGTWLGFAAGVLGGPGGWMLVASLPRRRASAAPPAPDPNEPPRRRRLAAADRGAHFLYRAAGVVLAGLNLVWIVTTLAFALAPLSTGALLLAHPGVPVPAFDAAAVGLLAVLGVLCLYTAATDRRLTRASRAGWLAALLLTFFGAALVYVPWRRARVLGA